MTGQDLQSAILKYQWKLGPALLFTCRGFFVISGASAQRYRTILVGAETMQPERKAGITIVFGVPAIVGAGLVWQLSGNWQVVFGYLGLLAFVVGGVLANPEQIVSLDNKAE
jgi:hypothetical protein